MYGLRSETNGSVPMFREGAVLSRGPALKAQKHRISRCPYFANDFKTPNSSAFRILVEKRTR